MRAIAFDGASKNVQAALVLGHRRSGTPASRAALIAAAGAALLYIGGGCGGSAETTTDEPAGGAAGSASGGEAGGDTDAGDGGSTGGIGGGGVGGNGATGGHGGSGGSAGMGGAGGESGSGGLGGSGGTPATGGAGGVCDQADWEPNDSESTARPLADIDDCDDHGGNVKGTLAPGDVDWFTFKASDSAFCSIHPFVRLASADNVSICMFFKCDSGTTEVQCPEGTQDWSSNPSHPGCCTSLTPMEPTLNCTGTIDETARVWLQVSWLENTDCRSYSIDYHE